MVWGVTVRSRNVVADIGAGFKSLVGGEIKTFTTLCEGAREEALTRMLEQAAEREANGVVGVRYDTNSIADNITEVIAYGMAVSDVASNQATPLGFDAGECSAAVCTSNDLPGGVTIHRSLGVVQGLTVRSRNVVASIGAGFKSMVGGEIQTLTTLCKDSRKEAFARMLAEAVALGADGVVAVRYSTGEVTEGVTEVMAYGTAVKCTSGDAAAAATEAGAGLSPLMITTSSSLPGLNVQSSFGIAQGITVRSRNVFRDIGAGLKSIVGGEINTWTKLCGKARKQAMDRMCEQAGEMGAKGIIAFRYDTNQLSDGIVEVVAYGTAVSDAVTNNVPRPLATDLPSFVSTELAIPGHASQCLLGVVRGISVQSVNLVRDIGAGLKSMVGGEVRNYSEMCQRARECAFAMMLEHAAEMGATGIVAFRYECNDLVPGTVEVVAYGTAVSVTPRASNTGEEKMLVSTTNTLIGQNPHQTLGVVRGITVRSRNAIANIGASFKSAFVGGEIDTWRNLCDGAREQAYDRMLEEASKLGATGIVAMRFETNEICPGITEVLAYGTALR
jgi:uncharacterized protein YbjQ (UPF0145 family)